MPYHTKTRALVRAGPSRNLGVRLGRLAVKKRVSVQEIANRTGASRTTVYSWFAGGNVTNAYRNVVKTLLENLQNQ